MIVRLRKDAFRNEVAEYVVFAFVSLLAWSEVAMVRYLILRTPPTFKEYLSVAGCFSICWSLGFLPFREILEKLSPNQPAILSISPDSSTKDLSPIMQASEVLRAEDQPLAVPVSSQSS